MALRRRTLNFPKEISDALALFVEIASPFGVMDHALLGGGTVLAARWGHRLSVDLDFSMQQEAFDESITHRASHLEAALRGVAFGTIVTPNHLQCVMRDTTVEVSVSVASANALGAADSSDEAEHGVGTQTTSAILLGKIAGRMMRQGRATVRDIYDLCVAERLDADALRTAARSVPARALVRTAELLEQELAGNQRLKPLLAPAHTDLAEDLAARGRALLLRLGKWVETAQEQADAPRQPR